MPKSPPVVHLAETRPVATPPPLISIPSNAIDKLFELPVPVFESNTPVGNVIIGRMERPAAALTVNDLASVAVFVVQVNVVPFSSRISPETKPELFIEAQTSPDVMVITLLADVKFERMLIPKNAIKKIIFFMGTILINYFHSYAAFNVG